MYALMHYSGGWYCDGPWRMPRLVDNLLFAKLLPLEWVEVYYRRLQECGFQLVRMW